MSRTPERVICLSAEAADWLWRLDAWNLVAGVTTYFEPPPGAPPKPRVSGFSSANVESILRLRPDLVLAFSDVQAGIVGQLVLRGCNVLTTNQRTLAEIESALALIARCVDRVERGEAMLAEFRARLAPVPPREQRPCVYFEEWDAPLISGIAWVSELIERAGGEDIFHSLATQNRAPDRIVTAEQVRMAQPELILASWCGKPVDVSAIRSRPGWSDLPAVRDNRVFAMSGADILQPGFNLVHGYEELKRHIAAVL
jgi:iron complex transport system substrate-binding protein